MIATDNGNLPEIPSMIKLIGLNTKIWNISEQSDRSDRSVPGKNWVEI